MKAATTPEVIPQIIAIVPVSREGRVSLKKEVRTHLGAGSGALHLDVQDEVLLISQQPATGKPVTLQGNRCHLPEEIVARLGLKRGSLLAMIQRKGAVALKKLEIEEQEGDRAQVVDVETALKVTRVAQTSPMPDKLLPRLKERYSSLALKYDVRGFLRGRRTLDAWEARQLIGVVDADDDDLQEELIRERLDKQGDDGSWEGQIVLTAKSIRELGDLGVPPDADSIQKAVGWLLARPQSAWNPGMFFANDELVAEQAMAPRYMDRMREERTRPRPICHRRTSSLTEQSTLFPFVRAFANHA